MLNRSALRLYAVLGMAAAVLLVARPSHAQYKPRPMGDPATGEQYHIEVSAGYWSPSAEITVSSQSLGIVGSQINFVNDLGLTDSRFPEFHLVLRPFLKHKLRFEYIPISYTQSATLKRDIVFNGQRYTIGLPVNSSIDWKAMRFGYEYDAFTSDRGFVGLILDAKYTNVTVNLASPVATEFASAKAPIPTIGGIGRVYVMPNISITGEVTGASLSWVPQRIRKNDAGHFVDVDVYGTINFSNNIGAQVGYRSFDVEYLVNTDQGALTLKGLYFGVVARY